MQGGTDKFHDLDNAGAKISSIVKDEISLLWRILLYLSAWIIALVTTDVMILGLSRVSLTDLNLIPFFPAGLAAYFQADKEVTGLLIVIFFFVYAIHGYFILTIASKTKFIKLYVIFVIILILNVVGCQQPLRL